MRWQVVVPYLNSPADQAWGVASLDAVLSQLDTVGLDGLD